MQQRVNAHDVSLPPPPLPTHTHPHTPTKTPSLTNRSWLNIPVLKLALPMSRARKSCARLPPSAHRRRRRRQVAGPPRQTAPHLRAEGCRGGRWVEQTSRPAGGRRSSLVGPRATPCVTLGLTPIHGTKRSPALSEPLAPTPTAAQAPRSPAALACPRMSWRETHALRRLQLLLWPRSQRVHACCASPPS
jgi:hypothetical protein